MGLIDNLVLTARYIFGDSENCKFYESYGMTERSQRIYQGCLD